MKPQERLLPAEVWMIVDGHNAPDGWSEIRLSPEDAEEARRMYARDDPREGPYTIHRYVSAEAGPSPAKAVQRYAERIARDDYAATAPGAWENFVAIAIARIDKLPGVGEKPPDTWNEAAENARLGR